MRVILPSFLLFLHFALAAPALAQPSSPGHHHHAASPPVTGAAASAMAGSTSGMGAKKAAWTDAPLLIPGGNRHTARLKAFHLDPTAYLVSRPDHPQPEPFPAEKTGTGAAYTLGPDNPGGYYRFIAREESSEEAREKAAAEVRVATTLRYFSNPGPAPRALLAQPLEGLEIVPETLPREHSHYRAAEAWPFLVRFHGAPLAGVELTLTSALGDKETVTTDPHGRAMVTFPQRYKKHGGRHGRAKTGFVLSAAHTQDGKNYRSAFNYHFIAPHAAGKSMWAGAGFLLLGMALALPLLRRKKEERA